MKISQQSHILLQEKKSVSDSISPNAPKERSVPSPTSVGTRNVRVRTPARGAPKRCELQRAHTPTHSHLERKPNEHHETNTHPECEDATPPRQQCLKEQAYTPLRHLHFQKELASHPDKAWVTWLIEAIQQGVTLGHDGPRGPMITSNLPSSRKYHHIIDKEINKECRAGRLLGPFSEPPMENLKCSGVGVVLANGA